VSGPESRTKIPFIGERWSTLTKSRRAFNLWNGGGEKGLFIITIQELNSTLKQE